MLYNPIDLEVSLKYIINSGVHRRISCPVHIENSDGSLPLSLAADGKQVPVQQDGNTLVFIPLPLETGETAVYSPSTVAVSEGVHLEDNGDRISVTMDGDEFTNYWYKDVPARPYFWPVYAPGGVPVTRAFPMQEIENETQDHPHQRSLYFAYGDVNGVDNWSELPGHGYTIHKSVDELVSGPVFGRFATTSDWTSPAGDKLLTQKASVTFWRGDSACRLMDIELTLTASENDVLFGDTKEGGILSVRAASSMDVERNDGGHIENSFGGIDENEDWGRSAHWCDYSGMVDGHKIGIAVMDHPHSFRYPTYWHVRNYGLMTANPFALAAFTANHPEPKEGSHLLKAGESIRFKYRIVIHTGDAAEADIRQHYLNFVSPPIVTSSEV